MSIVKKSLFAALAYFSVTGSADASMTMYFGPTLPNSHLATFDTLPLGFGGSFALPSINATMNLSNAAHIVQGTVANQYAAPYLDTTRYVSVNTGGTATFLLNQPAHYFGLDWGSVDTYNTLTFYSGNTIIDTFNGAQMIAAANLQAGNQGATGTVYVNFTSPLLQAITKIVASSSGIAFEFDDVRVSAAPLPAALPMFVALIGGFGAFGARLRRKFAAA